MSDGRHTNWMVFTVRIFDISTAVDNWPSVKHLADGVQYVGLFILN